MAEMIGGRYCGIDVRILDDDVLRAEFGSNPASREICRAEMARRRQVLLGLASRLVDRYQGLMPSDDPDYPADVLSDLVEHCHLYECFFDRFD